MVQLSFKLDTSKWIEFLQKKKSAIIKNKATELLALGDVGIVGMQSKLPNGKLKASIGKPTAGGVYEVKMIGDTAILTVGTALPYCVFVNRGVIPHPIDAKNKKYMKFYWELFGREVFFKRIPKHPGMRGKFYLEEGQNAVLTKMNKDMTMVFE